ncbi:hypothetical protein ACJJTC_009135 [Scirpophaga incertulas]
MELLRPPKDVDREAQSSSTPAANGLKLTRPRRYCAGYTIYLLAIIVVVRECNNITSKITTFFLNSSLDYECEGRLEVGWNEGLMRHGKSILFVFDVSEITTSQKAAAVDSFLYAA